MNYSSKNEELVKSQKTPSPLTGEGRGEGENNAISNSYIPLPLIPSYQGRGNPTFYEIVKNRKSGFTLVEMLIAMTIGLIILAALSSTFIMQRKIYDVQEQIVEMVQTARAAMDMMTREIRMAGYDPAGAVFDGITYDADKLQIYADLNGDKDTNDPHEYIKYTIDSDYPFEIRRDTGGGRQEFALNIKSFTFDYLKADGVTKVTTTADNNKIRQIKITITARTSRADGDYSANNGYRTHTLTSLITPRNLGL